LKCFLQGALAGLIVSAIVNLWIGVGSALIGFPVEQKPYSINGCSAELLSGKEYDFFQNP
jgi:hypothetical protein